MHNGADEGGTGLAGFRRYTWWAVPGTNVGVLILFTGEWILDGDVPIQPRVFSAAALVVEVAAVVVLLNARLASGERSSRPRPPAGWPVAGALAAIVLALPPTIRTRQPLGMLLGDALSGKHGHRSRPHRTPRKPLSFETPSANRVKSVQIHPSTKILDICTCPIRS